MKSEGQHRGRVFVLGSLNMDIVVKSPHHPQVGETVLGDSLSYFPGGKGLNQAVAAARDGAEVVMLGALGDDSFAMQLQDFAASEGIDMGSVNKLAGSPSGVALIVVATEIHAGDNTIVVAPGANGQLTPEMFAAIDFRPEDVLLGQFEVPRETTEAVFARARAAGTTTILNPAPAAEISEDLFASLDYWVVNDTELAMLESQTRNTSQTHRQSPGTSLSDHCALIHTQGSRGVSVRYRDEEFAIPAHEVAAIDTTAAGDCFCGVLSSSLLEVANLKDAVKRGNAAAAICVQREGAAPSIPTRAETDNFLAEQV